MSNIARLGLALVVGGMSAWAAAENWTAPTLAMPNTVELRGVWGGAYSNGMARLERDPFTVPFLLADVDFGMKRWFTNYSGDISGRFLEVASLSSAADDPRPATLKEVMKRIGQHQRADGHFGAEVDWGKPIDLQRADTEATMMPILWGNGRLLLGLVAAAGRFDDPALLRTAKKLGDFYEQVVAPRFCDPRRTDEYRKPAGAYAGAYVTCVFQGIEGLVRLYRITGEQRYLKTAQRMADFHEAFDTLPVDHAHGSLSVHGALILLSLETRDAKYLNRAIRRWEKAVREGYVNPAGAVLEKFHVTGYDRDEGCAEADWLRLNLMLWRYTGETRFLDMAERLLWNGYQANQWPSGGFGHRFVAWDAKGPYAYGKQSQESLWCCSFHCPLGLWELKSFLAAGGPGHVWYNFPVDFATTVQAARQSWTVTSRSLPAEAGAPVRCEVTLQGPADGSVALRARVPEWADEVRVKTNGQPVAVTVEGGYARTPALASGTKAELVYRARPYLEDRRLTRLPAPRELPATVGEAVVRLGPWVMMNTKDVHISPLTLMTSAEGGLRLPAEGEGAGLAPWHRLPTPLEPHAFVFNVRLEPAK